MVDYTKWWIIQNGGLYKKLDYTKWWIDVILGCF